MESFLISGQYIANSGIKASILCFHLYEPASCSEYPEGNLGFGFILEVTPASSIKQ
jgi:hypothetical protein